MGKSHNTERMNDDSQMSLLEELLDVFGGRPSCARLEESSTREEGDDGEHLGRGAQLEDREEVGEVVPEDVARDANGVLSIRDALAREAHGVDGAQNLNVQPRRVVQRKVRLHLLDDLRVVPPLYVFVFRQSVSQ